MYLYKKLCSLLFYGKGFICCRARLQHLFCIGTRPKINDRTELLREIRKEFANHSVYDNIFCVVFQLEVNLHCLTSEAILQ